MEWTPDVPFWILQSEKQLITSSPEKDPSRPPDLHSLLPSVLSVTVTGELLVKILAQYNFNVTFDHGRIPSMNLVNRYLKKHFKNVCGSTPTRPGWGVFSLLPLNSYRETIDDHQNYFLSKFTFITWREHVPHGACVEARGQFHGVGSLFPP